MYKKDYYEDIIFAKATPAGKSAIAVIRISGKNSWALIDKIFIPISKNFIIKSHMAYYGSVIENIDNCLIITFAENRSFTGEESFEIHSHGSEIITSLISKLLIKNGVRSALPGEFTKRAFLNGKIDLTKAEAIMDIVNASGEKSAMIAEKQLSGRVSEEINKVKNLISDLLAEIEVNIDYPEEGLTYEKDIWVKKTEQIISHLKSFLNDFKRGQYYRDGINAVIMGKTNSGKSTLFNYLLNEDKAIVSDIHGTTRDFLDGVISISGYGVRIYDTAGLRKSIDPIEKEGTKKALTLSLTSDIVLYIVSCTEGFTDDDKTNLKNLSDKKILVVINKSDLDFNNTYNILFDRINSFLKDNNSIFQIIKMSALNKTGINNFNNSFIKLLINDISSESEDPIITNARHASLISKSIENLRASLEKMNNEILDLAAFELRDALNNLGEITGEITSSDILDKIFSGFCIGK